MFRSDSWRGEALCWQKIPCNVTSSKRAYFRTPVPRRNNGAGALRCVWAVPCRCWGAGENSKTSWRYLMENYLDKVWPTTSYLDVAECSWSYRCHSHATSFWLWVSVFPLKGQLAEKCSHFWLILEAYLYENLLKINIQKEKVDMKRKLSFGLYFLWAFCFLCKQTETAGFF